MAVQLITFSAMPVSARWSGLKYRNNCKLYFYEIHPWPPEDNDIGGPLIFYCNNFDDPLAFAGVIIKSNF